MIKVGESAFELIAFGLGVIQVLLYFYILALVFSRIKTQHPGIWNDLGRPTFWNTSFYPKYLLSLQYRRSGDEQLIWLGDLANLLFLTWVGYWMWWLVRPLL